jgi:Ni/Fe-hydrogenase 1 B-type cytochrome subunit
MTTADEHEKRHPLIFRALHLVIVIAVVMLILTGFYIHSPSIGGGGFLMSWARGVHFFAAGSLIIAVVWRLLGMFFSNKSDWREFIPNREEWRQLPGFIGYYLYLNKQPVKKRKYNAIQAVTYAMAFPMVIFQIVSGFALLYPDAAFIRWFNYSLFNNEVQARVAHYIVTWAFALFIMIHAYLVISKEFDVVIHMYFAPRTRHTHPEKEK